MHTCERRILEMENLDNVVLYLCSSHDPAQKIVEDSKENKKRIWTWAPDMNSGIGDTIK